MTTTIVRGSKIGDEWIKQACALTPVQRVLDANGQPTGNILTGPVRLAFCNNPYGGLFKPGTKTADDGTKTEGKYGTQILFTPYFDPAIFYEEYYRVCGAEFAEYYDSGSGQYYGLHSPFRNQAEKLRLGGGYTPNCIFMTCTSKYKPPVVDARMNPIVDESKVYPGVWAILAVNAYSYGKNPPQPKKGVAFGIQSVMIIADDEKAGGGAPDPRSQFQGVNVQPPAAAPVAAFGQPGMCAPPPNPNGQFLTPHSPAPAPAAATVACWMCGAATHAGAACPSCGNIN